MLRSFHDRKKRIVSSSVKQKRSEAVYGTKAYWDGLQRAFNKAKMQIYFNPDMKYFVTLTYAKNDNTIEEVMHDVKMLIKKETRQSSNPDGQSGVKKAKYIYIMEYQKRGSIHVHMITNNFLSLQVNGNGYLSLSNWPHGFTSVLSIKDFDNNFRPYLYLFKYMKKAQRIGKSFVHSSRNLTNYTQLDGGTINLEDWDTKNMERTQTTIETTNFTYYKNYLQYHDKMNLSTTNPLKGDTQWHKPQVQSNSIQELEKLLANHSQR